MDVNFLFLDDLIWQRLPKKNKKIENQIQKTLKDFELFNCIANHEDYQNVVIWGTGRHYDFLSKQSTFFSKVNVAYFVDTREEFIGNKIDGKNIYHPKRLLDDNLPIFICAVQAAPLIYHQIKEMSIDPDRVIKKMIL